MSDPYILFRSDFNALDKETQRMLYVSFCDLVYQDLLFMLNDHTLAEDAIQISLLKAIDHGPKMIDSSNMRAWLKKVARNTAHDLLRKNKKHRQHSNIETVSNLNEVAATSKLTHNVEELVLKLIRNQTLHQVLAEIKTEYRIVLSYHYIHEMTYKEIQHELGVTEQVLTQRLARARKKLYDLFHKKWGDRL